MFVARKISEAKWRTGTDSGWSPGEIPADAVTIDLRTRENALSFWRCGDGSKEEVEEAALAMAAASDHVETLVVVWLPDEDFQSVGLQFGESRGDTTIEDLVGRHVDVSHLDYQRLGKVASLVVSAIEDGRLRRIRRKQVRQLLAKAVEDSRVRVGDFKEGVKRELSKVR